MFSKNLFALASASTAILLAGGGSGSGSGGGATGGGGGGVGVPAGTAEVRVLNERIPAGGTVQAKYGLTTSRPITGGGPKLGIYNFSLDGVAVNSPLGTTAGVAFPLNGQLTVEIVSPDSDFGTNLDYPFITVTMSVPKTAVTGTSYPLTFQDTTVTTPAGPVTLANSKPGTLTVGGTVSIHGAVPGGGTWPAGTFVEVEGSGFVPGTKLTTKMRTSNAVYLSPTRMGFVLLEATTLDEQPITATNPDGSSDTYYSYLRGKLIDIPSRAMLRAADPIFQRVTRGFASFSSIPALSSTQFLGLAVQNPNPGPVSVTFCLQRTGQTASVILPSLGRFIEDAARIFGVGTTLQAGDVVTVNATSGIQILGITGDEIAATLKPLLPQ